MQPHLSCRPQACLGIVVEQKRNAKTGHIDGTQDAISGQWDLRIAGERVWFTTVFPNVVVDIDKNSKKNVVFATLPSFMNAVRI